MVPTPQFQLTDSLGDGWVLEAGFAETRFGWASVAAGPLGVVHLAFHAHPDAAGVSALLQARWPGAQLRWDDGAARECLMFESDRMTVCVRATSFQAKVWRALLTIPAGEVMSYAGLARRIGSPTAARAVGNAVGANPVAWLIPCHRVVGTSGMIGGYRWGIKRKRALLAWEQAWD
jgi:AraC family transcriptional regulator of adaptative response/methylated-DNA-[protein]-cysteine methyltransferase